MRTLWKYTSSDWSPANVFRKSYFESTRIYCLRTSFEFWFSQIWLLNNRARSENLKEPTEKKTNPKNYMGIEKAAATWSDKILLATVFIIWAHRKKGESLGWDMTKLKSNFSVFFFFFFFAAFAHTKTQIEKKKGQFKRLYTQFIDLSPYWVQKQALFNLSVQ